MEPRELNGVAETVRKVVREEIRKELKPINKRLDGMEKKIPGLVANAVEERVPGLVVDVIARRFPTLFPHS